MKSRETLEIIRWASGNYSSLLKKANVSCTRAIAMKALQCRTRKLQQLLLYKVGGTSTPRLAQFFKVGGASSPRPASRSAPTAVACLHHNDVRFHRSASPLAQCFAQYCKVSKAPIRPDADVTPARPAPAGDVTPACPAPVGGVTPAHPAPAGDVTRTSLSPAAGRQTSVARSLREMPGPRGLPYIGVGARFKLGLAAPPQPSPPLPLSTYCQAVVH